MKNPSITKRTNTIFQFISTRNYPSPTAVLNYIKDHLDQEISRRTLTREIEKLGVDFGIVIKYNKKHQGYYFDEDESTDVASFFKIIEYITLTEVFSDGFNQEHKLKSYVQFDDGTTLKGIGNLKPLVFAIKQKQTVSFNHYNYYKDTTTPYTIAPLMLKEYLHRWYVIGVVEGLDELRTFGIDRLSDIKTGEPFTLDKKEYIKDLERFQDIVGVRINDAPKTRIVIKTHVHQMRYLKSLPLHPSQFILPLDASGDYHIGYNVIPNYEFDIQILKMSMEVEVIEPQWYREHIKTEIEKMYNKYQN